MDIQFRGVYPILLTAFDDAGEFDEISQRRVVDFFLDAGVHGLVTLANASEGYLVSDAERDLIVDVVLDQVRGRVPVIVGVSHPSTKIAVERSQVAQRAGANGILSLPPFYGLWKADTGGIFDYFAAISEAVDIPIVVQDHPLAGIPMSPAFLSNLAIKLENVQYFKIEVPQAPRKIAETLALAHDRVLGIFGGMAGIVFMEELERGACGTMPSSSFPDVFVGVYNAFAAGDRRQALERFERYVSLIRFELELAGRNLQKELLKMGNIIDSAKTREPVPPAWDEVTKMQMVEMVGRYDLLALHHHSPGKTGHSGTSKR